MRLSARMMVSNPHAFGVDDITTPFPGPKTNTPSAWIMLPMWILFLVPFQEWIASSQRYWSTSAKHRSPTGNDRFTSKQPPWLEMSRTTAKHFPILERIKAGKWTVFRSSRRRDAGWLKVRLFIR